MIILMAVGTVLLGVAIIVSILALFNARWRVQVRSLCRQYGILALFLLSGVSIAGSLYLQYGVNLNPCLFCWWQRICMYPVALIALVALVKGRRLSDIADYVLSLSVIGTVIALYQSLLQMLPSGSLIPCDAADDCAVRSVLEFGFVTLPLMAAVVFIALALVALLGRQEYSE